VKLDWLIFMLLVSSCSTEHAPQEPTGANSTGMFRLPPQYHWPTGGPSKVSAGNAFAAIGTDAIVPRTFGGLAAYDVRTGKEIFNRRMSRSFDQLAGVGNRLVAAGKPPGADDYFLLGLEYSTLRVLWEVPAKRWILSLIPVKEGKVLALTSGGAVLRLNVETGETTDSMTLKLHQYETLRSLSVNASGIWVVSDLAIRLLRPDTLEIQREWKAETPVPGTVDQGYKFTQPSSLTPHGMVTMREATGRQEPLDIQAILYPPDSNPVVLMSYHYSQGFSVEAHGDFAFVQDQKVLHAYSLPHGKKLWAFDSHRFPYPMYHALKHHFIMQANLENWDGMVVLDNQTGQILERLPYHFTSGCHRHPLGLISYGGGKLAIFPFSNPDDHR
jgi:hypothetical protein